MSMKLDPRDEQHVEILNLLLQAGRRPTLPRYLRHTRLWCLGNENMVCDGNGP